MAEPLAEPFHVALAAIRDRLRTGALPPGARATAVDLADELGLSTTPVREALSRVAGEGLLEDRRGQGYFVRTPGVADIADLYRMNLAYLLIALEPRRAPRPLNPAEAPETGDPDAPLDPVSAVEAVFRTWMARSASRPLFGAFRGIQIQLGPVRRVEPEVLGDLVPEARGLVRAGDAPRAETLALLRRFHALRIREAPRLAARLEATAWGPRK